MTDRYLSICSGIGGLDLGLKTACVEAQAIAYVEIAPFCQEILLWRMDDGRLDRAPIWPDLTTFDGRPWRGRVDGIIGGYPCQPFSQAGRQRGAHDERHLWPHIARVIDECGPTWLFFENVAGHLRLGFARVLADLAALGFDAEWDLFRASDVGAPHRRERLFILAYREGARFLRAPKLEDDGADSQRGRRHDAADICDDDVAHRDSGGRQGFGFSLPAWQHGAPRDEPHGCSAGKLGHASIPRLEGRSCDGADADEFLPWPPGPSDRAGWAHVLERWPWLTTATTQSDLRDMAHGVPIGLASRKDQLMVLGNAVVPAQAAFAYMTLQTRARS